ncbi:hypothetical protein DFS34DRAFT_603119 [Phlyctochytrium arcticum]|nr:hypothetical protein DFS34DRAFT_603119 [Phlyctochytrium arcticum]
MSMATKRRSIDELRSCSSVKRVTVSVVEKDEVRPSTPSAEEFNSGDQEEDCPTNITPLPRGPLSMKDESFRPSKPSTDSDLVDQKEDAPINIAQLPHELLSMILNYIDDRDCLARLAFVNRKFNQCTTPILYRWPNFHSTFAWAQFVQTVTRNNNSRPLGSYVQVIDLSSPFNLRHTGGLPEDLRSSRAVPVYTSSGSNTIDLILQTMDLIFPHNLRATIGQAQAQSWQAHGHPPVPWTTYTGPTWNHPIEAAPSQDTAANSAGWEILPGRPPVAWTMISNHAGPSSSAITSLDPSPGLSLHQLLIDHLRSRNNPPSNSPNNPETLEPHIPADSFPTSSVDTLYEAKTFLDKKRLARLQIQSSSLLSLASACPNLLHISLSHCPILTDILIKETNEYLSALQHEPQPYLTRVPIPPVQVIEALSKHCPRLISVDLRGCDWFTDDNIEVALQLENLRALNLGNCANVSKELARLFFCAKGESVRKSVLSALDPQLE